VTLNALLILHLRHVGCRVIAQHTFVQVCHLRGLLLLSTLGEKVRFVVTAGPTLLFRLSHRDSLIVWSWRDELLPWKLLGGLEIAL
jgi:hypothetical protein